MLTVSLFYQGIIGFDISLLSHLGFSRYVELPLHRVFAPSRHRHELWLPTLACSFDPNKKVLYYGFQCPCPPRLYYIIPKEHKT